MILKKYILEQTVKKIILLFMIIVLIILLGLLVPQHFIIPVENATKEHWDSTTFWHYPWGQSIVHKGVDIFAKEGTNVYSATNGIVISTNKTPNGGNIIYVLGPKWRLHYYAHLQSIEVNKYNFVFSGDIIGKIGNTGNAAKTPHHLHYSIETLIPYPWRCDNSILGWKKMYYLNPTDYLNEAWTKNK
jgi:peptidoglycan LD-endopeptidase LytH